MIPLWCYCKSLSLWTVLSAPHWLYFFSSIWEVKVLKVTKPFFWLQPRHRSFSFLDFYFQTFFSGNSCTNSWCSWKPRIWWKHLTTDSQFFPLYKDVLFYFKWWTYLITVPPTSCFVGMERKQGCRWAKTPLFGIKRKLPWCFISAFFADTWAYDTLFAGENINMMWT